MELIKIKNNLDRQGVVKRFLAGQVGVVLSDTIYGLSCSINKPEAIEKIYKIKNRPRHKLLIILISDFLMLEKYFSISKEQKIILQEIWLSANFYPSTFILSPKKEIQKILNIKSSQGVAVRLPKNDFLIKMIRSINTPLASTSCNLSGEPEVGNLREIISLFKKQKFQPDFVVSYNKARPRKKPSKIIDIRNINNIKLIRF